MQLGVIGLERMGANIVRRLTKAAMNAWVLGWIKLPIISVAQIDRNLERLRDRARDSLEKYGGVDAVAISELRVDAPRNPVPDEISQ